MEDNTWAFSNGYWKSLDAGHTMTMSFNNSETHIVKLDRTPRDMALLQKGADAQNTLSFAQLREVLKMLRSSGQDLNTYKVQLYQKISIPLATLVFALIGTPLGLRPHRSSSAMGLGLSIVIIFAYWVLMNYMSILGNSGVIHPAAASFIPTIAGIAAGILLIVKAAK
jgi:lipopolysaccharide export system permease protein